MYCKICGDIAKGNNYGVISCMSCKVFVQRYELKTNQALKTLKCRFPNGPCQISPSTRKHCTHCRLTACLKAGMHRNVHTNEEITKKQQQLQDKRQLVIEQKYKHAQLGTLDVLLADRSSLNTNQWRLISNITHVYDKLFEEYDQKIRQLYIYDEQKPIKMRLKLSNYQQLLTTYFAFIVPFLKNIPEYQSLELPDQLTLIHHNMVTLTGIHSHFMISTTGFIPYFNRNYAPIMNMIYGHEIIFENEQLRQRIDGIFHTDLFLFKLVLAILAFSNFTAYLSFTSKSISKSMNNEMIFSKRLFQIQNNYVDVLWRYMLFRFRHETIVVHLYSNIIHNCLHVQNFSHHMLLNKMTYTKLYMIIWLNIWKQNYMYKMKYK